MRNSVLTSLALMLCHGMQAQADTPLTYEAHYEAHANGLSAKAERSLSALDDGSYLLDMQLDASIMWKTVASLEQSSRFEFTDDGLRTQAYDYQLSGVRENHRSVDFDWAQGHALSREDDESWDMTLDGQTYDPLSHQYELRQALLRGERGEQEYVVIENDEIEPLRYRVIGEEILETPLGRLNTIKMERVRPLSSKRSTVIWFASDWQFLLARIEQVSGSGLHIEMELDSAELDGEPVTPLQ